MTSLEQKLNALNSGKSKLETSGNRTQKVRTCVSKIEAAFQDYIKSDNVSVADAVTEPLSMTIEQHQDVLSAVSHLNSAIRETEAAIEAERKAAQEAAEAKLRELREKMLHGGIVGS